MNAATAVRNPSASIEARTLTDRLLAAPTIAAEERCALDAGLTLGQARALALLVLAEREDAGLRRLLQRDDELDQLQRQIEGKMREYARSETPAVTRLLYRETAHLVDRVAERAARLATEARQVVLAAVPPAA